MRSLSNLIYVILMLTIWSCIPKTDTPLTTVKVNLHDAEQQKIIQLQATQNLDSIYSYLKSKDPSHRYLALQNLASIRKNIAIDSVFPLLTDQIMEVRTAAAFALGQIGDERAVTRLLAAFRTKDTISVNTPFNAHILEAVGKIGDLKLLKSMASVQTYRVTDSLLLLGQIKGIYRFMLRNIVAQQGSQVALKLLRDTKNSEEIRLYAAHYFARGKETGSEKYANDFIGILNATTNMDLRLPIVLALGKTKDPAALPTLKSLLITTQDFRMKVNVIKALGQYPYESVRLEIGSMLRDQNHHISVAASQFFLQYGNKDDIEYYQQILQDSLHWKAKANIYGCLLKHSPIYNTRSKTVFTEQIKAAFEKSNNPYEKAQLIQAISQDPFNYPLLETLDEKNSEPVEVAIAEGYKNILMNPNFFKAFGYGYPKVKAHILDILLQMIVKNDAGTVSVAAQILREPSLGWREWIKDTDFLKEALGKIKMPAGLEAYRELDQTVHYLEGKEYKPESGHYHQKINWDVLLSTTDSSSVAVKTTKGTFRIKLHPKRAPFSVSNFLKLTTENYFQKKVFHRVEPNFVIQTGCPRGDGYGSLDYTIPSELTSGNYLTAGMTGMASAGNHTECSQWFVTHTAAPHLDGNYTVFGHISEGQDVINNIDIGDKIIEIIFVR